MNDCIPWELDYSVVCTEACVRECSMSKCSLQAADARPIGREGSADWTVVTLVCRAVCRERANVPAVAGAVGRFREIGRLSGDPLRKLGNVQHFSPTWCHIRQGSRYGIGTLMVARVVVSW